MAQAPTGEDPGAERPTARDLVRRRRGNYRAPETGRHHHIGAAPERQPLLGEAGAEAAPVEALYVEASAVQLAQRTVAQLHRQRDALATRMARAADELDFERAARLRDELAAVDGELTRRG